MVAETSLLCCIVFIGSGLLLTFALPSGHHMMALAKCFLGHQPIGFGMMTSCLNSPVLTYAGVMQGSLKWKAFLVVDLTALGQKYVTAAV